MRDDDQDPRELDDMEPGQRTSRSVKTIGYAVIALLILAVILLATGAVKFGPY